MTRDYRWMMLHDGELEPSEELVLRRTVFEDRRARAKLESLRRLGSLIREVHAGYPEGPDLTESILSRVGDRSRGTLSESPIARRQPDRAGRRWIPSALGAAVLAVSLWVASSPSDRSRGEALLEASDEPAVQPGPAGQGFSSARSGVSVQSVDFGEIHGAIFVVSQENAETPVIWTFEDAEDKG